MFKKIKELFNRIGFKGDKQKTQLDLELDQVNLEKKPFIKKEDQSVPSFNNNYSPNKFYAGNESPSSLEGILLIYGYGFMPTHEESERLYNSGPIPDELRFKFSGLRNYLFDIDQYVIANMNLTEKKTVEEAIRLSMSWEYRVEERLIMISNVKYNNSIYYLAWIGENKENYIQNENFLESNNDSFLLKVELKNPLIPCNIYVSKFKDLDEDYYRTVSNMIYYQLHFAFDQRQSLRNFENWLNHLKIEFVENLIFLNLYGSKEKLEEEDDEIKKLILSGWSFLLSDIKHYSVKNLIQEFTDIIPDLKIDIIEN